MKKPEEKNEVLYIRISKETKAFIGKAAQKLFGTKRKEAPFVNMVFEELRENGIVSIEKNEA